MTNTLKATLAVQITVGDEEGEIEVEVEVRVNPGCNDWWDRSIGAWMPGDSPEADLHEARWNGETIGGGALWDALYGLDWLSIVNNHPAFEPEAAE